MDENDKAAQVFDQQKPNRPWYKLSGREWLICLIIATVWQGIDHGFDVLVAGSGRDLVNFIEGVPVSTLAVAVFLIVLRALYRPFTKPQF